MQSTIGTLFRFVHRKRKFYSRTERITIIFFTSKLYTGNNWGDILISHLGCSCWNCINSGKELLFLFENTVAKRVSTGSLEETVIILLIVGQAAVLLGKAKMGFYLEIC